MHDRPHKMSFDLRHHRWPITYCLSPNSSSEDRKQEKAKLINKLNDAIKLSISDGLIKLNKENSYARKIISEIKEDLLLSNYSPTPAIAIINEIYSQLELNAIHGELLDVEIFLNFIKVKYLPKILQYLNSNDGRGQNSLDSWNKIFSKNGSILAIKKEKSSQQVIDLLDCFWDEMRFSEFVPVQSKEGYDNRFGKLSEKAIDGNIEDLQKFKEFLINDYFNFLRAYGKNSEGYITKWNEIFGEHGILSKIENRYKYL